MSRASWSPRTTPSRHPRRRPEVVTTGTQRLRATPARIAGRWFLSAAECLAHRAGPSLQTYRLVHISDLPFATIRSAPGIGPMDGLYRHPEIGPASGLLAPQGIARCPFLGYEATDPLRLAANAMAFVMIQVGPRPRCRRRGSVSPRVMSSTGATGGAKRARGRGIRYPESARRPSIAAGRGRRRGRWQRPYPGGPRRFPRRTATSPRCARRATEHPRTSDGP